MSDQLCIICVLYFYRLAFARNKMGQLLRVGQSPYQQKNILNRSKASAYLSPNKQVIINEIDFLMKFVIHNTFNATH